MGSLTGPAEIEGLLVQPLREIADERGAVLHMLRSDSPLFMKFGEIYFSEVHPGGIKAWKRHSVMTQHFAVPVGRIRVVAYDDRTGSRTRGALAEYEIGRPEAYFLLRIPPMIWYGFQGLGPQASLLVNCTDVAHDPAESEATDASDSRIPYKW